MSRKAIVIISGAPGTGKTTLVNHIRQSTTLPVLEKDAIKEFFFDYIGHGDREFSKALGKAAIDAQFALLKELLKIYDSILLETAFYADIARDDFINATAGYETEYLEFYCFADEPTRRKRFQQQANDDRHPGHADLLAPNEASDNLERYKPLGLGRVIEIDTGDFLHDEQQSEIVSLIKQFIKE